LQSQALAVGRLLNDSDDAVRQAALATLEEWAHARRRLSDRAESAAKAESYDRVQQAGRRGMSGGKSPGEGMPLEAVSGLIRDRDWKVRLAGLDILEALGPAAMPAGPAVVKALDDPNRFVRWAAARALGKIGAAEPARAVPALARLLREGDDDLRL